MKQHIINDDQFLHIDSLVQDPKMHWVKDPSSGESSFTTQYQDDIEGEKLEIIQNSEESLSLDFARIFELYFPLVLERVQNIIGKDGKQRPKAQEILSDARNWEVIASQKDTEGKVFDFLFRPIRNKLFQVPKKAEMDGFVKNADELVYATSFKVSCLIEKLSEEEYMTKVATVGQTSQVVEAETLDEQPATSSTSSSEVVSQPATIKTPANLATGKVGGGAKKAEKVVEKKRGLQKLEVKNRQKYSLQQALSLYVPLEEKVIDGERKTLETFAVESVRALLTPEFTDFTKVLGPSYANDLHKDSVTWIEKIPLEKRLVLIDRLLPEYLKILSTTVSGVSHETRAIVLEDSTIGWDAFNFEACVIRSYLQAGKHQEVIAFLETLRGLSRDVALQAQSDGVVPTMFDVRSLVKLIKRTNVGTLAHGGGNMYRTDTSKMMYQYSSFAVKQIIPLLGTEIQHLSAGERIKFIMTFLDGRVQLYQKLLDSNPAFRNMHETLNLCCGVARMNVGNEGYKVGVGLFKEYMKVAIGDEKELEALDTVLSSKRFGEHFAHAVKLFDVPKA